MSFSIRDAVLPLTIMLMLYPCITLSATLCPPLWTAWGTSCYRYFGNPYTTWQVAENLCKGLEVPVTSIDGETKTGVAHLVSILSAEENQFVLDFWKSSREETVASGYYRSGYEQERFLMIGLNDIAKKGSYAWTDGSPVSFQNWAQGQPSSYRNEDAVLIWDSKKFGAFTDTWNDLAVNILAWKSPFMCKMPGFLGL